jgi:cell division septum initiation protein DivIVA
MLMNTEELLVEINLLREENEKLKKQLENYNNSRKSYYEKNKDIVKQKAKERLKKIAEENPNKIKEYAKRAYHKQKEKKLNKEFINDISIII